MCWYVWPSCNCSTTVFAYKPSWCVCVCVPCDLCGYSPSPFQDLLLLRALRATAASSLSPLRSLGASTSQTSYASIAPALAARAVEALPCLLALRGRLSWWRGMLDWAWGCLLSVLCVCMRGRFMAVRMDSHGACGPMLNLCATDCCLVTSSIIILSVDIIQPVVMGCVLMCLCVN